MREHQRKGGASENIQKTVVVLEKPRPVSLNPIPRHAPSDTYTALRPVDMKEGEGEQGLVSFFGQQLLLELHEVGF